jgi:hypothetical protein
MRGSNRVFLVIFVSASIILFARLLAPFEVGTDQSQQLEAARRLTEGLGLTTTNISTPTSPDISETPTPEYLTWWPPGLSLIVAGFLAIGLPLLLSLKVIYGVTTIAGWIGWGLIINDMMSKPFRVGKRAYPVRFVIAALLPVFYTPLWKGTDIFLWAGIPFFTILLLRTGKGRSAIAPVIVAGLLFGFLCGMRYASLFLGAAAFLILLQTSYPDIKSFVKRFISFLLPSLAIILCIFLYLKLFSNQEKSLPEQVNVAAGIVKADETAVGILKSLPVTSDLVLGFPLLGQIISSVGIKPLTYLVGIISILIVFSLPLIVIKGGAFINEKAGTNLALSISFLPLSLVIFLLATRFVTYAGLFGVRRYYEPVILCGVLIFYRLASTETTYRMLKMAAGLVVLLFAAYLCLYRPALFFVPERRGQAVQSVLGYTPTASARIHSTSQEINYPGYRLYTWKENSRLKVKQLYEANPQALFFAQEYPVFMYDRFEGTGLAPGENMRKFPGITYLKDAYTSRPVKVFWIVGANMKLYFIPASNLKLVFYDPIESTRIYESDFPAGYRFFN